MTSIKATDLTQVELELLISFHSQTAEHHRERAFDLAKVRDDQAKERAFNLSQVRDAQAQQEQETEP